MTELVGTTFILMLSLTLIRRTFLVSTLSLFQGLFFNFYCWGSTAAVPCQLFFGAYDPTVHYSLQPITMRIGSFQPFIKQGVVGLANETAPNADVSKRPKKVSEQTK